LIPSCDFFGECQVCDVVRRGADVFWITEQQVPFAVLADQWIAFDDDTSLINKVCERQYLLGISPSHSGQLSLLPSAARAMSTSQSAPML